MKKRCPTYGSVGQLHQEDGMRAKWKAWAAAVLCIAIGCCGIGCAGNDFDESTTTVVRIIAGGGGLGTAWITDAAARFEEKQKDYSYAPGKTGVKVVPTPPSGGSASLDTANSDAYMIYGIDNKRTLTAEVQRGTVVSLNDMMTERETETRDGQPISVDDKLYPHMKSWYKADQDGAYYGVPYIENYAGLSYNKDVFDEHGFYFAKPDAAGERVRSIKYGKTNTFIHIGDDASKSCGPDGKYGTRDDGLPSSLVEFLCLCERMKTQGVSPINLTGQYQYYTNFMQEGILASLIGYERYQKIVQQCDSGDELVDVVVGFGSENLFPGIDYIKKPIVKQVKITPETGYYSTWMVEKFYTDALLEIIENEDYFAPDANNENASHLLSQQNFLAGNLGGRYEKIGMLVEASYWNYESQKDGNYAILNKTPSEIDVRWMPLPVTLFDTVTDKATDANSLGQDPLFFEYTGSYMCINSRYKDDPEHLNASKDFLRFLMTDAELSHWTASNCTFKPMTYDMTQEDMNAVLPFYKDMRLLMEDGARVLYNWSDSPIFRNNKGGLFGRGWISGQFGTNGMTSMLIPMRKNGFTSTNAFVDQLYNKADWAKIIGYDTNLTVGQYGDVTADFSLWKK